MKDAAGANRDEWQHEIWHFIHQLPPRQIADLRA
jgi:hypothetical protein